MHTLQMSVSDYVTNHHESDFMAMDYMLPCKNAVLRFTAASHPFKVLLWVLLFCVAPFVSYSQSPAPACNLSLKDVYEDYECFKDGDIVLGGVFTVKIVLNYIPDSVMDNDENKGKAFVISLQSYVNVLMFMFAIDKINQDPDILPNITLGYHLYDSWSDPSKAVRSVLQILSGPGKTIPNYSCTGHGKLAGVIGDHYSFTTIPIAQILGLYRYTQISYGSSDYSLSDRHIYPHVFRMLQSHRVHYLAISKLVKHFGWTWVGIFLSDDETGENDIKILKGHLRDQGICVAFAVRIGFTKYFPKKDYTIVKYKNPHVVIFCGIISGDIFLYLKPYSDLLNGTVLIFPPSWAFKELFIIGSINENAAYLAVDLFPFVIPGFEKMFDHKEMSKYSEIRFLEELVVHLYCASSAQENKFVYLKNITSPSRMLDIHSLQAILEGAKKYLPIALSSRVYYAVEAMATAIHNMDLYLQGKNLTYGTKRFTLVNGNFIIISDLELYQYCNMLWKKQIQLTSSLPFSLAGLYRFLCWTDIADSDYTAQGEFVYRYEIVNWIFIPDIAYDTVVVGNYTPWAAEDKQLLIDSQAITWNHNKNKMPESRCSEICQPGSRKKPGTAIHSCCYDCAPCSEGDISNTTDSEKCVRCLEDEWPNEKKDRCIPKLLEFLSYTDDISKTLATISVLLCLVTLFIMGIFIHHLDTAIVKANNRSLSFVLLVCIMLSFLCVFLFLGHPLDITCILRVTTFGLIFSTAVSSLLAKTIMVYIAFTAAKPGSYWRKWIGSKLPNSVVLLLSSVQVMICLAWLSVSHPFQEMDIYSYLDKIIIQCNEGSVIGFYSVLGYMGFLAAVSFVLAFMVRTLPDSFNEAKYITFSMLVFCSVWIAMIPAYLSTRGKYMVAVEVFTILVSSAGLLSCIFFPKCFMILFRPDLNTQTDLLSKKNRP
ncbi:PREDICTED: vomeronasal type-2 receptor 26-like [Nanorana parkeri]|uniref:vomeronasal type-2 receptor 26-like n=1 Tax=Nanorana parkeri TaxID=125878 RepID=UPI000854F279|nr:PREDICTED: vomeronasal type-2 receptor 26-like [Nanorana parkeri]